MPSAIQFSLKDANGGDHAYEVETFPLREADPFFAMVKRALETALGTIKISGSSGVDTGAMSVGTLIAALNTISIGDAQRLLVRVARDGKGMSNERAFDEAYRANLGELYLAVYEVARVNGFFLLPISLPSASVAAGYLTRISASLAADPKVSVDGAKPSPTA
jgi:hypothetical protein